MANSFSAGDKVKIEGELIAINGQLYLDKLPLPGLCPYFAADGTASVSGVSGIVTIGPCLEPISEFDVLQELNQ